MHFPFRSLLSFALFSALPHAVSAFSFRDTAYHTYFAANRSLIKGAAWIGEGSPLQYAAQPHAISTQKENSCQVKIFSYSAPLSPLCQSQNIFLQYPPASWTAASRSAASRSADRPKLYDLSCPHPPASRTAASRSAASRSADRPKLYVLSCHHHPASRPTGSNFTF